MQKIKQIRFQSDILDNYIDVFSPNNLSAAIRRMIPAYVSGERKLVERLEVAVRRSSISLAEGDVIALEEMAKERGVTIDRLINLMLESEVLLANQVSGGHKPNTQYIENN